MSRLKTAIDSWLVFEMMSYEYKVEEEEEDKMAKEGCKEYPDDISNTTLSWYEPFPKSMSLAAKPTCCG